VAYQQQQQHVRANGRLISTPAGAEAVPGIAPEHAAKLHHVIDLWIQRLASAQQPLQQPQQP
jgi:hypothetical protein